MFIMLTVTIDKYYYLIISVSFIVTFTQQI